MTKIASELTDLPVWGNDVSGEATEILDMDPDEVWERARGHVFKALDPLNIPLGRPPRDRRIQVIWMDRKPTVQAKSFARFARVVLGADLDAVGISKIAASFRRDRPKALALWSGLPMQTVQFGELVTDPHGTLVETADFLGAPEQRVGPAAEIVDPREGDVLRETMIELETAP